MIVLGPHVLSALGPEAGVGGTAGHDDADDADGGHASSSDGDPPPRAASPALGRVRAGVSSVLGSVGAPPLTSGRRGPVEAWSDRQIEDLDDLEAYVGSVGRLASSHACLIGRMRSALADVGTGTAVRLGLGPAAGDGRRGVSRAERAWAARHARESDSGGGGGERGGKTPKAGRTPPPALSMHRIRTALHRSIADAALSLLDVLDLTTHEAECPRRWKDFGGDLRHSLDEPPVLTLSQLAGWVDGLAGLLSHVLSSCLADSAAGDGREPLECAVRRSTRLAEERASYLEGVASGTLPHAAGGTGPDPASRRRAAGVAAMCDALEAARISLLAFELAGGGGVEEGRVESRVDGGLDSSDGWWAHFARLLERVAASASEFEEEFVRPDVPADVPDDADDGAGVSSADVVGPRDELEVIVSDAPYKDAPPMTRDGAEHPGDRVLVFSGSGTRAAGRRARRGMDDRPPSAPFAREVRRAQAHRADLMDDLRSRLRSMGIRREVEVVRPDDCEDGEGGRDDGGLSTGGGDVAPTTSRPLFMGVSGAMLTELTGALEIHSRREGGDEIG